MDRKDERNIENKSSDQDNREEYEKGNSLLEEEEKENLQKEGGFDLSTYNDEELKMLRKKEQEKEEIPEDIYLEKTDDKKHEKVKDERKEKKKTFKGSFKSYILVAIIASLIGGILSPYIGTLLYGRILPFPPGYENNAGLGDKENININSGDTVDPARAVALKAMDSVVGITTLQTQNYYGILERDVEGVGSGVIVHEDGYILTNSHVVADGEAKEVKVLFNNGETSEAEILWNDSTLDLAVLRVPEKNLPAAELGDSDKLEVGEIAVAIGNPLGLEFQRTVTQGIISGLNRSIQVDEGTRIDNLIQTDASINRGNSGGPLLNKEGKLIGINTAKIGSAEGLGFSIPINTAKPIFEEVIETGTYETVVIGISPFDVSEYQARLGIDLGIEEGVIVLEITSGGPADRAGLEAGDVIIALGDKEIKDTQSLKKELYNYKKGEREDITIVRNEEKEILEIEFESRSQLFK